jgi:hypothetical protein
MNKPTTLLLSLAAAAIFAPGAALASALYDEAGGEIGATTNPSHMRSQLSRSDVLQTVDAARKDGTLAVFSRGGALPVKATAPAKTREQVRQEFLDMSPAEKARLRQMHGNGG